MPATPAHHRFAVDDYERLCEVGILDESDKVELIQGEILTKIGEGDPPYPAHHRFTVDEYEQMVERGILTEQDRAELIHGEILTKMTIGDRHAACVNRMARFLIRLLDDRAVLSIQNPIRLPESVPEPDLALLAPRADYYAQAKPTPEDILLLIEVSDSSLDFDRRIKRPLYARGGIQEFWIVNLIDNVVEIHRDPRPDGSYAATRETTPGQRVEPLAFPGLRIAIDQIIV